MEHDIIQLRATKMSVMQEREQFPFTQDMRMIHSILAKPTLIAQRLSVDLLRTGPACVAGFSSTQVEDQGYMV